MKHKWVIVVAVGMTEADLNQVDRGETLGEFRVHANSEIMYGSGIGCYECECLYEPRVRHEECPGDPAQG